MLESLQHRNGNWTHLQFILNSLMVLQSIRFLKCWELLKKKRCLIQVLLLRLQNVPLSLPHNLAHKELHREWKKWQHSGSEDYLINSLPVFGKVTELKTLKSLLQKRAGITFFNYGAGVCHTLLSKPTNPYDSV